MTGQQRLKVGESWFKGLAATPKPDDRARGLVSTRHRGLTDWIDHACHPLSRYTSSVGRRGYATVFASSVGIGSAGSGNG